MSNLTLEQVREVVGQTFVFLHANGQPGNLVLQRIVGVEELPEFEGRVRSHCFSLHFLYDGEVFEQGILTLHHETLGQQNIFLVPVGKDPASGSHVYQAVFG